MKMETIVTSDKSGIIKNILVQSSDNVESKDLLIISSVTFFSTFVKFSG